MQLGGEKRSGERILIGRVVAAHGLRGELSVVPLTDYPERFSTMECVAFYTKEGDFVCKLPLLGVRHQVSKSLLLLETSITERHEAELLVGACILIDKDERVELPDGRFWVDDLIGLQVFSTEGSRLGVVSDVLQTGANDIYEVEVADGSFRYVPAVSDFVESIDVNTKRLVIRLVDGLWD